MTIRLSALRTNRQESTSTDNTTITAKKVPVVAQISMASPLSTVLVVVYQCPPRMVISTFSRMTFQLVHRRATSTPVPMVKHGEMPSLTTTTVSSTADSARTSVSVSPSVAQTRPLSPHQATSCHSVFPSAVLVALPSSPEPRLMLQPYSHPLFSIISATTHQIPIQSSVLPPTELTRRSFPVSTCKVLRQTNSRTAQVTISLSTPLIAKALVVHVVARSHLMTTPVVLGP